MNEPNVNQRKLEVLKTWYSIFCAIMTEHQLSEEEIMQKLRQLRKLLKEEAPELEAS